jgi:hypothetical protein
MQEIEAQAPSRSKAIVLMVLMRADGAGIRQLSGASGLHRS